MMKTTVAELIESLSKWPGDLPVEVWHHGAAGRVLHLYEDQGAVVIASDDGDC